VEALIDDFTEIPAGLAEAGKEGQVGIPGGGHVHYADPRIPEEIELFHGRLGVPVCRWQYVEYTISYAQYLM